MAKYYGIDLGTTNTVVYEGSFSVFEDDDEDDDGYSCTAKAFQSDVNHAVSGFSMPSVLYIKSDPLNPTKKIMLVGKDAEMNAMIGKENAILLINTKRFTGKEIEFEGGFTPLNVATEFLGKCAEAIDKRKIVAKKRVCVTHPASYNIFAAVDTKKAAIQAGFKNVSVLEEPRAALLSFLYEFVENEQEKNLLFQKQKENGGRLTILVVDIGGGTTDVTIQSLYIEELEPEKERDSLIYSNIQIEFLNYDIDNHEKQSKSNNYHGFGGMDFDKEAMKHLMLIVEKEYKKKTGQSLEDISQNDYETICGKVMRAAEEYKKGLSQILPEDLNDYESKITLTRLYRDFSMEITVKSKDYVRWVSRLCDNTDSADYDFQLSVYGIVYETLQKSGYTLDDLSYVFVTGGMSQYTPIRDMLKTKFGGKNIEVRFSNVPMDDVARGAALFGNYFNLSMPATVLNTNYYIDNPCGEPILLAKEGTALPTPVQTKKDFMRITNPVEVAVSILSGDGSYSQNLKQLENKRAELIYPDSRGTPIDVRYSIADNQELTLNLIVHHKEKDDEVITVCGGAVKEE